MLRGGHQPSARVIWNALPRPLLKRSEERILRQILGQTDVVYDARKTRDDLGGFNPPDGTDRTMCGGN
jgi:hypothetical protein